MVRSVAGRALQEPVIAPEYRKATFLAITPDTIAPSIEIADAEVKAAYDRNPNSITAQTIDWTLPKQWGQWWELITDTGDPGREVEALESSETLQVAGRSVVVLQRRDAPE